MSRLTYLYENLIFSKKWRLLISVWFLEIEFPTNLDVLRFQEAIPIIFVWTNKQMFVHLGEDK